MSKKRPAPDEAPVPSRDELMDSLPYVDVPNEDYEQYALALIEAEMKVMAPRSLPELAPIKFRTPAMEQEYQRYVVSGGQPDPIEVPTSTPTAPSDGTLDNWSDAVHKARIEYESERLRGINLEVKKDAGAALLWKGFNGNLDHDMQSMLSLLQQQKERVEQINLQRSQDQEKAGQQLSILINQYQEALQRRFQLHHATLVLEQEVQDLMQSS